MRRPGMYIAAWESPTRAMTLWEFSAPYEQAFGSVVGWSSMQPLRLAAGESVVAPVTAGVSVGNESTTVTFPPRARTSAPMGPETAGARDDGTACTRSRAPRT